MITILAWFWAQPDGRTQYTAHHVNIWADMVRRHMVQPHRLACVTDQPEGLDSRIEIIAPPREFEDIRIPTWGGGRPQCLRRLSMFRPDAELIFGPRFVCMDIDCVISASLDPLFETEAEFKMCGGTGNGRPYNGSMMLLKAGARPQVYAQFTPEGAAEAGKRFAGSDQAWISHVLGRGEATWAPDDGVVWHGPGSPEERRRVMFFPGKDKPWMAAKFGFDRWINEHYRREPQGRCLILGYEETLWRDVSEALKGGPFDAVIASPEAAEHWPGEILAVAQTNDQAGRLAWMHGLEPTWCGVREAEAA